MLNTGHRISAWTIGQTSYGSAILTNDGERGTRLLVHATQKGGRIAAMCGIAGVAAKPRDIGGQRKHCDPLRILQEINQYMRHRGPDEEGFYVDESIALSMTRLRIVGGASGRQPIWNEDGTIALVCNGEIYNYRGLRAKLESMGHTFTTASDVEAIIHLYEMYKEKCVQFLEGIFAFALWDSTSGRLFLARDRCGVKPLYYMEMEDSVMFSSEFKALLAFANEDATLDSDVLSAYHSVRFCPPGNTMVKGIQKLHPAEYVVIDRGQICRACYWSPAVLRPKQILPRSKERKADLLKGYLFNAVKSQAAEDVKDGILLSGGLDSTALLAIHHQLFGTVPDTFTIAFERPRGSAATMSEYCETEQAAAVARHYGSQHTSQQVTARQALEALPAIISALDEPIADPTAIPLWFAVKLAKKSGARVLYSGEGLDELFHGYELYRQAHWLNALQLVPRTLRTVTLATLERTSLPGRGVLRRSLSPLLGWYQGVGGVFSEAEMRVFVKPEFHSRQDAFRKWAVDHLEGAQDASVLMQMSYFDLSTWLPENTLVKSDKVSMSHSVELRVPFLSQDVVEMALSARDSDKLHWRTGKWIVRQALTDILPSEVLRRKKAGFPIPLTAWIFNEWKEYALTTLLDASACTKPMYHRAAVEKLFSAPEKDQRRAARLIWTLLSLELWMRYVYSAHLGKLRQDLSVRVQLPRCPSVEQA